MSVTFVQKKIATAHTMKRHRRDKIHDAEDDISRNEDEESNDDNNEAKHSVSDEEVDMEIGERP